MTIPITTDIFHTTPPADGFDFPADNETVKIFPGITVFSEFLDGVRSSFSNSTLLNRGHVVSGGLISNGVFFSGGANGKIVNGPGGQITGFAGAVMNDLGSNVFDNYGLVASNNFFAGLLFATDATTVLLNNYGTVFSLAAAVEITANSTGGLIQNYSRIEGGTGIYVHIPSSQTTIINNHPGGIIRGTTYAIDADSGGYALHNYGTIIGEIIGFLGTHQIIVNHGKINGEVVLSNGNDIFNGAGGTSGNIIANGGNDHIIAGNGKVLIALGEGSDTVTAGPGHDQIRFDSALLGQIDKITNFHHAVDEIVLTEEDFTAIGTGAIGHLLAKADFHVGTQAVTASQYIIYDPHTGFLYYDSDGSGPALQKHFATLSAHLNLTHTDFLVQG